MDKRDFFIFYLYKEQELSPNYCKTEMYSIHTVNTEIIFY